MSDDTNKTDSKTTIRNFSDKYGERAGKTTVKNDTRDTRTPEEKERASQAAKKQMIIGTARRLLAELEKSRSAHNLENRIQRIRDTLAEAGADMSALDPSRKMTAEQMEEKLQWHVSRIYVQEAAAEFENLEKENDPWIARERGQRIKDHLASARKDAVTLDPSGQSTAEEMEERIKQAIIRNHIACAREKFTVLETETPLVYVDNYVEQMRGKLAEARTDMTALDSTGSRTVEEMEEYFKEVVACAHLRHAIAEIASFEKAGNYSDVYVHNAVEVISKDLWDAGSKAEELRLNDDDSGEQKIAKLKTAAETLTDKFLRISMKVRKGGMPATKPLVKPKGRPTHD